MYSDKIYQIHGIKREVLQPSILKYFEELLNKLVKNQSYSTNINVKHCYSRTIFGKFVLMKLLFRFNINRYRSSWLIYVFHCVSFALITIKLDEWLIKFILIIVLIFDDTKQNSSHHWPKCFFLFWSDQISSDLNYVNFIYNFKCLFFIFVCRINFY